jgi:hypothetical protein
MKPVFPTIRPVTLVRAFGLSSLMLSCLTLASAQQDLSEPKAEIKVSAGISTFNADRTNNNNTYRHTIIGGALRYYIYRQVSIEPEVLFMWRGQNDRDVVFTPHLALDLMPSNWRVVPYVLVGVGAEHHRDQITYRDFFNGNQVVTKKISGFTVSANAGVGAKLFLTDRLFVAPEVRGGHEPSFRASLSVGYVFAGRKR